MSRLHQHTIGAWVALILFLSTFVCSAQDNVRFAVIGDYGVNNQTAGRVAAMVRAWQPDFIVTVGDNSYGKTTISRDAFQEDVVKYYGEYILAPHEDPEGDNTRFFPSLGNHDYKSDGSGVALGRVEDYNHTFAVPAGPGGHNYYQFARGPVRFFALDSNQNPAWTGWKHDSPQAKWWRAAISTAREPWKVVFFHHSPYHSSQPHAEDTRMRAWRFETSGVTAVLAGHAHVYERVMVGNVPFITNGLGGARIHTFGPQPVAGSEIRYPFPSTATEKKGLYGALFVEASNTAITFEFWNLKGQKIDHWPPGAPALSKTPVPPP